MTPRKTHRKQMNVQDIAEVLIQHIDELKLLENKTSETIKDTLSMIELQHRQKIDIDTTHFENIAANFLNQLESSRNENLSMLKKTMLKVTEEQQKVNENTKKLTSELYEIQTEVKKLSKVGFGRLPNYLVATIVVVLGVIVLTLLMTMGDHF